MLSGKKRRSIFSHPTMRKPVVGVMGASLNDALTDSDRSRIGMLAEELGGAIARAGCLLMTGATTGIPHLVATAFRRHGGFALGVSPAENRCEHVERYRLPDDGADAIIYTGFGYKGRNLINVRSSDIVLLMGGATGTLNEFTIAYDEGKIVLTMKAKLSACSTAAAEFQITCGKLSSSAKDQRKVRFSMTGIPRSSWSDVSKRFIVRRSGVRLQQCP